MNNEIISIWIGFIVLTVAVIWSFNLVITTINELKQTLKQHKERIESIYTIFKIQEEQNNINNGKGE